LRYEKYSSVGLDAGALLLVEKKDKYILDLMLDVIIVWDVALIMDKLYIQLITNTV